MQQAVLVIDVQPTFEPPNWLVERCQLLAARYPSVATVFRHDEGQVPFERQLGWRPDTVDESLVAADHVVTKNGYLPTDEVLSLLTSWHPDRVLVCGIQADACVLAAGFALFDAGLQPACVADAVVGSSVDSVGEIGLELWRHHFGIVIDSYRDVIL